MSIKFLEGIATSDLAFEVRGGSINEVFEGCALALSQSMANPSTLCESKRKVITLEGENAEELLFDWLSELVYLKDAERALFRRYRVDVKFRQGKYKLKAECLGCGINSRIELRNDVKAITLHKFRLWKEGDKWVARVIADL